MSQAIRCRPRVISSLLTTLFCLPALSLKGGNFSIDASSQNRIPSRKHARQICVLNMRIYHTTLHLVFRQEASKRLKILEEQYSAGLRPLKKPLPQTAKKPIDYTGLEMKWKRIPHGKPPFHWIPFLSRRKPVGFLKGEVTKSI